MTEDRDVAWLLFEAAIHWCADPAAVPQLQKATSIVAAPASVNHEPPGAQGNLHSAFSSRGRWFQNFINALST
jgi:hypothetical protein